MPGSKKVTASNSTNPIQAFRTSLGDAVPQKASVFFFDLPLDRMLDGDFVSVMMAVLFKTMAPESPHDNQTDTTQFPNMTLGEVWEKLDTDAERLAFMAYLAVHLPFNEDDEHTHARQFLQCYPAICRQAMPGGPVYRIDYINDPEAHRRLRECIRNMARLEEAGALIFGPDTRLARCLSIFSSVFCCDYESKVIRELATLVIILLQFYSIYHQAQHQINPLEVFFENQEYGAHEEKTELHSDLAGAPEKLPYYEALINFVLAGVRRYSRSRSRFGRFAVPYFQDGLLHNGNFYRVTLGPSFLDFAKAAAKLIPLIELYKLAARAIRLKARAIEHPSRQAQNNADMAATEFLEAKNRAQNNVFSEDGRFHTLVSVTDRHLGGSGNLNSEDKTTTLSEASGSLEQEAEEMAVELRESLEEVIQKLIETAEEKYKNNVAYSLAISEM